MSNSYAPSTVSPYIPKNLIYDKEVKFLEKCGLFLESVGDNYFIYTEEGADYDGEQAYEEASDISDDDNPIPANWSVYSIFQKVIERSNGIIKEIIIEGANYADKLYEGSCGGFIVRVTKDNVQSSDTQSMLRKMRVNHPL